MLGGSVSVQTVRRLIATVDYSVANYSCFQNKDFEQVAVSSNEIRGSSYGNLAQDCHNLYSFSFRPDTLIV
jgi:hypothetical protein